MPKVTLTDISSGYLSTATFNANNTLIEAALEKTLSRDGTSPNTMSANLDLNSNKVVNITDGANNQDAVSLAQLNAAKVVASTIAATAVTFADSGGNYAATTAEAAFAELASASNGEGASIIGIEDAANDITATDVEGALAEIAAAYGTLNNVVEDTTPQLGGDLDANSKTILMNGSPIKDASLVNFTMPVETGAISSGVCTIDMDDGNAVQVTLSENITSFTLTNEPASGFIQLIIKFVQDGTGSRTVTWAGDLGAIDWPAGTAPTITTTATTGTSIITVKSFDGGTTWFGDYNVDYQ